MPKLPGFTAKQVLKVLLKNGFVEVRQKGSHIFMRNNLKKRTTVVPMHNKTLGKGLFLKIMYDTGLSSEAFKK